jgi:hypothetical protein
MVKVDDEEAVGLAARYVIEMDDSVWEGHRFWSLPDGIYRIPDGCFVHVLAFLAGEPINLAVVIDWEARSVIGHRFVPFPFYKDRAEPDAALDTASLTDFENS